MASKATYGALMGLGQGISQFGTTLTADTLKRQDDERIFSRQQSLQEISQRYQKQLQLDSQKFQTDKQQDQWDREDALVTPGTPLYQQYEDQRQKLRGEKQADSLEQIKAREAMYGSGRGGGVLANLNPSQWTPESFQPFMAEVNRLIDEDGMSADRAVEIVAGQMKLVPKPGASSADTANNNKIINSAVDIFGDAEIDEMIEFLQEYFPTEDLTNLTKDQLVIKFRELKRGHLISAPGLMNQGPGITPPANNNPLGLDM